MMHFMIGLRPRRAAAALLVVGIVAGGGLASPAMAAGESACQTGPGYFDYGPYRVDREAEQLAMNRTGALRAPDEEYARILGDLRRIRVALPNLGPVVDDPDYVPNQLIVKLDPTLPQTGYVQANAYYQVVVDQIIFGTWHRLTFCDSINASALAAVYDALPEVLNAEPNFYVGMDDQITISVLGSTYRYSIVDGFFDCPDGCDCQRRWVVDVDPGGGVSPLSYQETGVSWCEFDPAPCCASGQCAIRTIPSCLSLGGKPFSFSAACDGDGDLDLVDGLCGDNCPLIHNPTQADADADGYGDPCDCAPANPGAFAPPAEVPGLGWSADRVTLQWESLAGQAGSGTVYDILRGEVYRLPVGSSPLEICLHPGVPGPSATDHEDPPADHPRWYLARGRNMCGAGTYGATGSGAPRTSSACP